MDDNSIVYSYPLHPLDNLSGTRNIFVSWVMRFNDVLDADKLHQSLSRLLEMGDWRKLGGRIRRGKDGKLTILAPQEFNSLQPAVAFGHDKLPDSTISQHRVASLLPKPGPHAFVGPSGGVNEIFRPLTGLAMMPQTLDDIIRIEAPPLSLHVTSFSDATIVALSHPHVLTDGFGIRALLRSWSLVMAGREPDVPALRGATTDLLREAVLEPGPIKPEPHVLASVRLGKLSKTKMLLKLAADRMKSPEPVQRVMFLPESALRRLFEAEKTSVAAGTKDVLTAWLIRSVAVATAVSTHKPPPSMTVINAINARLHLPSFIGPDEALAQNMTLMTHTPLARELTAGPVDGIARELRAQTEAQTTEPQVLGLLQSTYRALDANQEPLDVYGESSAVPVLVNDLTAVDVYGAVDFGPAVVRRGDAAGWADNPPGTVVYYQLQSKLVNDQKMANVFTVWGRDRQGNYWLNATLAPKVWTRIEEAFKTLSVPGQVPELPPRKSTAAETTTTATTVTPDSESPPRQSTSQPEFLTVAEL
ncbi:alpha-1,2-mannosidase family protein [Ophiocordyceps camponoti-floridani]|uniref:Alpha-1,2-mannosidase family protein n=1 Tax=Ophiocordyceps camponoti-floridani TaxID=2030778 RepID=A0A8H4QBE2_9HYPO|nr:alpha-1,2-mannosidase family protein [Ophiocordyceps camponoti-floridani]